MRWRNAWVWLGLALITLAVYSPVIRNDFINLDDQGYVTENPNVTNGLSWEGVKWSFTSAGYASNWHPLTWISHMMDCQFFGLNPAGHHLTNLLFHTANALLLLAACWQMTGAFWRSAFVAAVFAWHPLHVESVAWVSERKDVLSTFFWLLTMIAYVSYTKQTATKRRVLFYITAVVFFALGLMAKPMLVTLPFVLLLLDYWPLGRITDRRLKNGNSKDDVSQSFLTKSIFGVVVEKIPFFILSILSCVLTILAQKEAGSVVSLNGASLGMRLASAIVSYRRYLVKFVWPKQLSIFYPPVAGWSLSTVLSSLILLAVITAFVIRSHRKNPYLCMGWLWFLGALVPVIGLIQVGMQSLADRYMYVPMIGLLIMVAWDIEWQTREWPMRKAIIGFGAAVVLSACLAATWVQVQYWRNSEILFRQALRVTPLNNFMAHACLGRYLGDAGKDAEAIEHFRAALSIAPSFYPAQFGLGRSLAAEGKWEEASQYLAASIQSYPNYAEAHRQLGRAYAKLGKPSNAMTEYRTALQLDPNAINAHLDLADLLADMEKYSEAETEAGKARDAATVAKRTDLISAAQKRLESFHAGKAYHEAQ